MTRIITVITDEGTDTALENDDANDHLDKLELTPTKFIQEIKRKLKDEE